MHEVQAISEKPNRIYDNIEIYSDDRWPLRGIAVYSAVDITRQITVNEPANISAAERLRVLPNNSPNDAAHIPAITMKSSP
jgi:hypothetical protein